MGTLYDINALPRIEWDRLPLMLNEQEATQVLNVNVTFLRQSRCEDRRKERTDATPFVKLAGIARYRVEDLKLWGQGLQAKKAI